MAEYFGVSTSDFTPEEALQRMTVSMNNSFEANHMNPDFARQLMAVLNFSVAHIDSVNAVAPPASKAAIETLVKKKLVKDGSDCLVCLKLCEVGEEITFMPCKHSFHSACLLSWLKKTNSCPTCRHELQTDDEEYEALAQQKLIIKEEQEFIRQFQNSMSN